MSFRLSETAADELHHAVRYYSAEDRNLGARFVDEVYRTISLLLNHPYLDHRLLDDYRRVLLKGFPYSVVYRIDLRQQLIDVMAISSQRRDPDAGRYRLEELPALYVASDLVA